MTPAFKQGFDVLPVGGLAPNGEVAVFETFASLAGNTGDAENGTGGAYEATRSAAGWSFASLNPSATEYPGQIIVSATPGSQRSLWMLHPPGQSPFERGLYVRNANVEWSLIGPLNTPSETGGQPSNTIAGSDIEPIAATADFGHAVIESPRDVDQAGHSLRWPFDQTAGFSGSLYEYSGFGNASPTLVAVEGEKGSTQLISRCGAVLGSARLGLGGSTYNALAADGETIFFTPVPADTGAGQCGLPESEEAPVAEVYARVHGATSSAAAAETIDVSARSTTECTGGCLSSVAADKLFEGASEDGSLAFFTSTQQLIDGASEDTTPGDGALAAEEHTGCAATTGAGGCNLYAYELATHRLVLVAGGAEVMGVARISEDGSRAYFVARGVLGEAEAGPGKAQPEPTAGEPNLYVYETASGRTRFIATLTPEEDEQDWQEADRRTVQASIPDGRYLVFDSTGTALTPDDSAPNRQMFEYDSVTNSLTRVSRGEVVAGEAGEVERGEKAELGYAQNGNAAKGGVTESLAEGVTYTSNDYKKPAGGSGIFVSSDGGTVAFGSRGRLSPRAVSSASGCASVYEFHVSGNGPEGLAGEVHLISDGLDVQPRKGTLCTAALLEMSQSGQDIMFGTADPLLSIDTDGLQRDVYDARVDGGFMGASLEAPCLLEGCRTAAPIGSEPPPQSMTAVPETASPARPPRPAVRPLAIIGTSTRKALIRVRVNLHSAGRLVASAPGATGETRTVGKPSFVTLTLRLDHGTAVRLARRHRLKLTITIKLTRPHLPSFSVKTSVTVKG